MCVFVVSLFPVSLYMISHHKNLLQVGPSSTFERGTNVVMEGKGILSMRSMLKDELWLLNFGEHESQEILKPVKSC